MKEEKNSQLEESAPVTSAKKKVTQLSEILGIEAVIVVVILLSIFMILNYFNIIPLSANMPKVFGWLPHQISSEFSIVQRSSDPQGQPVADQAVADTSDVEQFPITCPISSGFCAQAKGVYDKESREIEGLGYMNLGKELAIYAVFDGTITSSTEKVDGQDQTVIVLTGENGLVARYLFQGLPFKESGKSGNIVKQSDIIGLTGGGELQLFDFTPQLYSLRFSLESAENKQNIPTIPREDGRALNLQ